MRNGGLALAGEPVHIEAMTRKQNRPMFKPMPFEEGRGWRVEVQWPDGATQHVDDFRSDYEACDWISNRSAAWLLKNPGPAKSPETR
jgi:hypothetical protein